MALHGVLALSLRDEFTHIPITVLGQLGFGLGWRRHEPSPGLTSRRRQPSPGKTGGPIRGNELCDTQSKVIPGLGWHRRQVSPGRTLIKNTVSLHMQQVRASPELETGQGQP